MFKQKYDYKTNQYFYEDVKYSSIFHQMNDTLLLVLINCHQNENMPYYINFICQ